MRIGNNNDYLIIEIGDPDDPYSAFIMEAGISNSRASFYGKNDAVMFSVDDKLKTNFSEFQDFKRHDVNIIMTESCKLSLKRDHHGNITVKYRIGYWKLGSETGLDGIVQVDGEWCQSFLAELKKTNFFLTLACTGSRQRAPLPVKPFVACALIRAAPTRPLKRSSLPLHGPLRGPQARAAA
jgi:hypothetical protein